MSELDKTIEELEADVLAELEEKVKQPTDGAAPSAKAEKIDVKTPGGEVVDGGPAVVDPEAKSSPTDVATKKAKEVKGDAQQKSAGKADKPEKLAAGHVPEGEEVISEMEMPKTKKEMLQAMVNKMQAEKAEPTEEELEKAEAVEARIKDINVKEDVQALMNADDSLSEDFKVKAATIFEAAVKSKVRSEIERIHEEVSSEKETEIESFKEGLTEKVDTYLNYVVEEWTKENELAIERGLKGEIAEDFISGLKQLFEDHYIDVPNEKYDVLEAQSERISELEDKLNESIEKSVELSNQTSKLVREQVISEVSEDLADTEIEKFKGLVEDVEFGTEESFREKLNTLKESYFPKNTVVEPTFNDEDGTAAKDIDTTEAMSAYLSAISRNQKASA
jgi:hypothetical protein